MELANTLRFKDEIGRLNDALVIKQREIDEKNKRIIELEKALVTFR